MGRYLQALIAGARRSARSPAEGGAAAGATATPVIEELHEMDDAPPMESGATPHAGAGAALHASDATRMGSSRAGGVWPSSAAPRPAITGASDRPRLDREDVAPRGGAERDDDGPSAAVPPIRTHARIIDDAVATRPTEVPSLVAWSLPPARAITWSHEPDPSKHDVPGEAAHRRDVVAAFRAEAARTREDLAARALGRAWVDEGEARAPVAPRDTSALAPPRSESTAREPAPARVAAGRMAVPTEPATTGGERRTTPKAPEPPELQIDHLDVQIIADPAPAAPASRARPSSGAWVATARHFVRRR